MFLRKHYNAAENPCKRGHIYDCFILNQCCRAASTWRLLRSSSSATVASPGFVANFWKGRSNRYCCTRLCSEPANCRNADWPLVENWCLRIMWAGTATFIKRHRELVRWRHANLVRQGFLVTLQSERRCGLLQESATTLFS